MTDMPTVPYNPPRLTDADALARSARFLAEMDQRRSVRDFSDDPVPREIIENAILTASTAPSGAHMQPWTFVLTRDPVVKREIRLAAEQEERENYEGGRLPQHWRDALEPLGTDSQKSFLETAPWIIVVFAQRYGFHEDGSRRHHYYVMESVGIACGMFIAALHNAGVATLTHTPSPMRFLTKLLGRPENERPFILFPVGYPAPACQVPDLRRKTFSEVAVEVRGTDIDS